MLYVGHCTVNCTKTGGASYWFGILGASSQDLVHWKKETGPVVPWGGSVPEWAVFNGEPGWIYGPDGYFYVFPSGGFNVQPPVENFGAFCQPWEERPFFVVTFFTRCIGSLRRPFDVFVGIARSKQPFSGYAPLSQSPIVTHGPPGSASAKAVFAPTAMLDPRAGVAGTSEPGQLTARVWFFQSTDCTGWCPVTINEATAPWPLFKSDAAE
jgi:hypothetical protein